MDIRGIQTSVHVPRSFGLRRQVIDQSDPGGRLFQSPAHSDGALHASRPHASHRRRAPSACVPRSRRVAESRPPIGSCSSVRPPVPQHRLGAGYRPGRACQGLTAIDPILFGGKCGLVASRSCKHGCVPIPGDSLWSVIGESPDGREQHRRSLWEYYDRRVTGRLPGLANAHAYWTGLGVTVEVEDIAAEAVHGRQTESTDSPDDGP